MNRFPTHTFAAVALICVSATTLAEPAAPTLHPEAMALLQKMQQSMRASSYSGVLVHTEKNQTNTLELKHLTKNGQSRMTLTCLDGDSAKVTAMNPQALFALDTFSTQKKQPMYAVDMGRMTRVAGVDCRIVMLRPKDRMRFLQKYCINPVTGHLLLHSIVDPKHKVLEQLKFASFEVLNEGLDVKQHIRSTQASHNTSEKSTAEMATTSLESAQNTSDADAPAAAAETAPQQVDAKKDTLAQQHWNVQRLPKGFTVKAVAKDKRLKPNAEQYIVSDGMSQVSVYVEAADASNNGEAAENIEIKQGGLQVISHVREDMKITAVGEVPQKTLNNIVSAYLKFSLQ